MSSFLNNMLILGMGTGEIVVVALILLLLFGGKKIPELMRGLGRGVREFNDAKSGIKNEIQKGMNEEKNPESNN
jgi:sec-independent protein translocase protein TatA